ncbi:pentapeptide repeat-containing protein [Sinosporangium siamense]|uniref:pentapeptide repeat-containing protein n=1 Tax=Sinosporangium siamense TaxID=1367973 RepID=UPI0019509687|nr:pentapeptide repeat-containing protein [Sinosporangium siamense]
MLALGTSLVLSALPASAAASASYGRAVLRPAEAGRGLISARPCRAGQGANYRGRDLRRTVLPYSLRCADLTGAKLDQVDLTQKDMTGAILRGASLREADLTQARLDYADLRKADFTEADLGQMHADRSDAREAIFVDAEAGQAEFQHAKLNGAKFTRAVLTQATLVDAVLTGADLRNATLGQIKARKADFSHAQMHEAKLGQATLLHAKFRSADLREADFTMADVDGADFSGANVESATFTMVDDLNLDGAVGTPEGQVGRTSVPRVTRVPTTPPTAGGRVVYSRPAESKPRIGLIMVIAGAAGLGITLALWGAARRRHRREADVFLLARRAVEDDVTTLGRHIDALDLELRSGGRLPTVTAEHDWQRALDAYQAARNILSSASGTEDLAYAAQAVHDARSALHRLQAGPSTGPQ